MSTSLYYFDVETGRGLFADSTGTRLASADAALVEAISILQEVIRDDLTDGADRLLVATARDAAGQYLFRATLKIE
jgi:hypothetical protein